MKPQSQRSVTGEIPDPAIPEEHCPIVNVDPSDPSTGSSRARGAAAAAGRRGKALADSGRLWVARQEPASRTGAAIGWVRRYQAADGQLYAVLLSAYFFLTMVPVLLVAASYAYSDPAALAQRTEHRLGLHGATANLFSNVMIGAGVHKFSAVLLAVINLFFFGLGFPRVLQLAHSRAWRIELGKRAVLDQARYAEVLAAMVLAVLLFVAQTRVLSGDPSWIGWLLDVAWVAILVGFFAWAPRLLLHHRVALRDLLPGAAFTVLGLVGLRLISSLLFSHWLTWYSTTYGSFGIVVALFFWIILFGTILVLAAALSPALAHRRDLLAARG